MIGFRVAFAKKGGFDKLSKAMPMAIARGLNEGGDKVRTQVQKSLWKQTGATSYTRSILPRVRTKHAFGQGFAPKSGIGPIAGASLSYEIIVDGKWMKLEEFKVSVTNKGIDAKTWGVDHLFQRSFLFNGEKAKNPYKARLGKSRFPIRGLKGPNLAKELDRGDTPKRFYLYARLYVGPAILKHIAKAL